MRLVFTQRGWADYRWWQANDRATVKRINRLIDASLREPTAGVGKPEPLRHVLAGCWSRRIDEEHRLVYLVDEDDLVVLQARFHYESWLRRLPERRPPTVAGAGPTGLFVRDPRRNNASAVPRDREHSRRRVATPVAALAGIAVAVGSALGPALRSARRPPAAVLAGE